MQKPTNASIYEYFHYREYLRASLGSGRTGQRLALAKYLECPPSHISQVLAEKTHLTSEQGERATRFFNLSSEESRFFLTLVQYGRAGTPELRAIYHQQILIEQERHLSVANRHRETTALPSEIMATYYSSWVYLAIHLAVQLPQIKNRAQLASKLGVAETQLADPLEFLLQNGILKRSKEGFHSGPFTTFIGKDSPHLSNHHLNWRVLASQRVLNSRKEDIHYSSAFTASHSAALKIKENILNLIEENLALIKPSPDEELFVFTTDFFSF